MFKELFSSLEGELAARGSAADEVVKRWCNFFAELAAAVEPVPARIVANLSRASGLAAENLRAGIRSQFSGLQQVQREARTWRLPEGKAPRVAIVAAGNIPGVAIAPAVLLAAAGCPVVVKQAGSDRWLLAWLLQAFRARYPGVATGISAGYWPPHSAELAGLLQTAEVILAFGSDATIGELQQRFPGKVLGFGHKFSVALLAPEIFSAEIAAALALDIALFDQGGCLSAQAVFVLGRQSMALDVGRRLAQSLQEAMARLGRGRLQTAPKMRLHSALDRLDLLDVAYFSPETRQFCVAVPPRFDPELLIGHNVVQVVAVPSLAALQQTLQPFAKHLQGIALAVGAKAFPRHAQTLAEIGFSYISPPGRLQAPPLDWPNGGVLLPEVAFLIEK